MKLRAFHILAIGAFMVTGISSCDDKYGDDLRGLGRRVEILEDSLLIENREILAIQTILYTINSDGFITSVVNNNNGTYTIRFNNGNEFTLKHGTNGKDGKDGSANDFVIGVDKGEDGIWYWTLNGQWIIDNNGNRMRAGGIDGKNGKNGKDGKDDINMNLTLPMTRINPITRYWEISIDNGSTYTSTGILADGKDGKDGSADNFDMSVQKGEDGIWYWTVNNKWIYDGDGNRMPAGAIDGKDGKDGKDDINMSLPIPVTRINPATRLWEISTDNGVTFIPTGIPADGKDGKDGKDGSTANLNIGITKIAEGTYCWTVNGQLMTDANGNPLRANGKDGVDGVNGKDGKDDINMNLTVPLVHINPITRLWEISTDGGYTYQSTGILADGQNGTNGIDGKDDTFLSVIFSSNGNYAIITLRNGQSFTVPVHRLS